LSDKPDNVGWSLQKIHLPFYAQRTGISRLQRFMRYFYILRSSVIPSAVAAMSFGFFFLLLLFVFAGRLLLRGILSAGIRRCSGLLIQDVARRFPSVPIIMRHLPPFKLM
jgi:hypothetical protein